MWKDVLEDSSIIQEYVQRGVKIGEDRGVKIGEDRGVKIGEDRGVKIAEERANVRLREILFHLGEKQFGPPDPATRDAIEKIADPDRLAALNERVIEVKSWQELLA